LLFILTTTSRSMFSI